MSKTNSTILFSLYYILGLIGYFTEQVIPVAIILFVITIVLLKKNIIGNKFSVIVYLAFILAILNCNLQIKDKDFLSTIPPQEVTLSARVVSIPTTNHPDRTKFYTEVQNVKYDNLSKETKSKTLVTIYDKKENLNKIEIGDILDISGKLSKPKQATNPSQFDYARYLKNLNTYTLLYVENDNWQVIKKANTPYWKFLQSINNTRDSIIQKHSMNIKSPNIELLGGIVFGDDAVNPSDEIKKSFINSGLLHIIAASGMNVTLIFGLWFFLSQKVKMHYRLSIATGILLILFYTCMTGFGPSILRATLMLVFILLGKLIDREADNIALLFFVAFLLLLYDPCLINNIGFQLSFAVTFGLLLTCPFLFESIENKTLNFIASTCFVPLIAQLYAAPIQMFYFNTFATYSIFANIAIIPFLMVVSFLGFISSIIAMIPYLCTYFCKLSDWILNPFLSALINISNFFSNLPHAIIQTPSPSIIQLIVYFTLILTLTCMLKKPKESKKFFPFIIILLATLILISLPIKYNDCEVIFFDMGNADSTLIKTPLNKYVLIDTGKAPYKNSQAPAEQIILKYFKDHGIKNIDLLILTHFDSDHTGGSLAILKNIKVKEVLINDFYDNSNLSKDIINYLKTNKISYKMPKQNEELIKERNFSLVNLTNKSGAKEENEHSLINLLTYKKTKILFMADSGTKAYTNLPKKYIGNVDVIKIGHHGGKDVVNSQMLKQLNPKVAVISTGKNPYGHPKKETIEILRESHVKTLRTDYNNAIKISLQDQNVEIDTFKTNLKRFTKLMNYDK